MLIPLVGPSCAGKSLLLSNLQAKRPEIQPLESVTTRPRRPSDTRPGEYLFVSDREFDQLEQSSQFLWVVHPHGLPYRYGTRKQVITDALTRGLYAPILVLDAVLLLYTYAGGLGQKDSVRPLYLHIADEDELRRRFVERGDSDPSDIGRRVLNSRAENDRAKIVPGMHMLDATQSPEKVLADALAFIRLLE
jgi:guanylate kinase